MARKPFDMSSTPGVVPATIDRTRTWAPAMWLVGNASSHVPGPPSRSWVASAEVVRAAASSSTVFGSPVDPEVGTPSTARDSDAENVRSPSR